ncbi:MAG: hypothetical protein PUG10_06665 [Lachnospiraceae bacterium]|nr:hypothetical protein [Lachnospiraceae bacterium]
MGAWLLQLQVCDKETLLFEVSRNMIWGAWLLQLQVCDKGTLLFEVSRNMIWGHCY